MKTRISTQYADKHVTIYQTEMPDEVAAFAMQLIEKHANIAAIDDGEDTAGRHKIRLQTVDEVVTRSFDIAQRAFDEARVRGMMVSIPDLNEINASTDADAAKEIAEAEQRKKNRELRDQA